MANQDDMQGGSGGPESAAPSDDVTEIERLRARCHELEETLRLVIDNVPLIIWRINRDGVFELQDGRALAAIGLSPGQFVGQSIFDIYPESGMKVVREALEGKTAHELNEVHGGFYESWTVPVRNPGGEIRGVLGVTLDTTEMRRTERELREQFEVVERQRQTIQELSTPILQVWERVLALPMIGVIDSVRTSEVMDSLLDAVASQRARFALLDLTGVEAVDTQTAAYLIDLVRAIRLLGAEGIITGIRPSVAQTIVAIGVDLSEIVTLGNLRAGLRHCIVQMRREQAARS